MDTCKKVTVLISLLHHVLDVNHLSQLFATRTATLPSVHYSSEV